MTVSRGDLWTIDELAARVTLALTADYEGPPNGRVRAVPDRRTIRYYTTLGLLDRPATLSGRTALYGRRHLLQLVAIKRLQARGLTLAELQEQLLGLTDARLAELARLPPDLEAARPPGDNGEPDGRRAEAFWKTPPAPAEAEATCQPDATVDAAATDETFRGIRLGDGVTLLLAAGRPVDADDIAALRTAAGPLLKLLEKRRLLRPRSKGGPP
jgi:DNA-binding transcriptional MerR regulator